MPFIELGDIPEKELLPGLRVRFVHSEKMTLAYWSIDEGAMLPEHSHPHEQVANVIEGHFELTVDGESRVLRPGSVVVIPPDATHSGKALGDCKIIDVFYPVREDYK